MTLNMIIGPLVGAVIGYCTNYIAVKMLFRPLGPKYIGKYKVPFTPGIIPKGRERLAKAVGQAVGGTLLTEKSLRETLLSDDIKNKVGAEALAFLRSKENDQTSIEDELAKYIGEDRLNEKAYNACQVLTDKIYNKVDQMNVGNVIADQVITAVKQKVQGGLAAMMLNDQLLNSFAEPIASKVNDYFRENGRTVIYDKILIEKEEVFHKEIGDVAKYVTDFEINIEKIAITAYENLVTQKLSVALDTINFNKIVEDKISEMDVLEVEELIMSVMKKELNAIVNLGALIGFILGIIMIFA